MSSDEQRQSRWIRWRSPRYLASRLGWLFVWGVFLYATTSPWRALGQPPTASPGNRAVLDTAIAVVFGGGYVWYLLHGRRFRTLSAEMTLWLVLFQVVYTEGYFAQWYYNMSAAHPDAFGHKLTGVDAAYFAISTATTTGMGDIHPVTSDARLIVTGQ
jgi:hypothetical protein